MGTGGGIRITTCRGFTEEQLAPGTDTSYASVSVYRQGCDDLQCYVGSNNTCTSDGLIEWNSEEGEAYHVLVSGDEAAIEAGYMLMHDHTDWEASNCEGASNAFADQLRILKEFFDSTGNTQESGPLLNKGWVKGCDICNKWDGLQCGRDNKVTRIDLGALEKS